MTLPTESENPTTGQCKTWPTMEGCDNPQLTFKERLHERAKKFLDDWPTVPLLFGAGAVVGLVRYVSLKQGKDKGK